MKAQQSEYDVDRVFDFLHAKLSDDEILKFEHQLSESEHCRETLTNMTAEPALWTKVGRLLRDEADDERSLSSLAESENPPTASIRTEAVIDLLDPSDDPLLLGKLDDYEIGEVIGVGGMGVVLKANDPNLNRVVAIKVMDPILATSVEARKRFFREAKAVAAVTHENVIEVFGISEFKQLPYLVMPYSAGASLQSHVDQYGPLPIDDVLKIGIQIASGLEAAHNHGLVHRDIKPANILLNDETNRLVITDFGLARAVDDGSLTRTGVITGTPQYMSPEQTRGESVDVRSDLFSLGSLLYFACTGRVPFQAESSYGTMRRISDFEPMPMQELNPKVPEWLATLINRLMKKQPTDRYQSAQEVVEHLRQCLSHMQTPKSPLPDSLRLTKRRVGLTVAVVLLFVSSSIAYSAWLMLQEKREQPGPNVKQLEGSKRKKQTIPLTGQTLGVNCVAIDRKSKIVATGSGDRIIRLYSMKSGELLKTIHGHNDHVNSIAFHPTEDRYVTAGLDGVVHVWTLDATTPQLTLGGFKRRVNEAVFSPDGKWIAAATWVRTVEIWDAKTGKKVRTLHAPSGRNSVCFSPDGNLIASGGWDRKTYIWETKTFDRIKVLERHRSGVFQSVFSPNGKLMATASDDSTVIVWDTKKWIPQLTLQNPEGPMNGVAFSPDGKRIATVGDGTDVAMWSPKTGKLIQKLAGHPKKVLDIEFSPDGKSFATGGYGRTAILWKNY